MVPSDPRRLRTAVSVTQPYSGRRPEPPVAGCRLGIMARSRQRTPIPRAASFGRQKHGLRFRSRWTSAIFGPRRCTNCARSGSTRPREPWATGTYESMASCRSSQPLKPTPSSNPLHEITRFQSPNSRIAVLQQPLASGATLWTVRELVPTDRESCAACRGPSTAWPLRLASGHSAQA